jgi:ABC-type dipeptide/oligopeptide/nickel transport system ATPase component
VISPETIIEISNLTIVNSIRKRRSIFSVGKRPVSKTGLLVADMNLNITRNKIHGIVGESGSGKSLSVKSILGLIDIKPGIISGAINFRGNDDIITDIIGEQKNSTPSSKMKKVINTSLKTTIDLKIAEYQRSHRKDNKYYLKHHPIPESIELYVMKNKSLTKNFNFSLNDRNNVSWIEVDSNSNMGNVLIVIAYKIKIDTPGSALRRKIEKNLVNSNLRGDKISMILQDPQTFLNPYWSIGEQLANIIKLQNKRQELADYAERNYAIRIAGDIDDYPVHLTWDKDLLKGFLRYADLRVNGDEVNMLDHSRYKLDAKMEVDLGKQTVGKKFVAVIHLRETEPSIKVSWDNEYLRRKILEGTILYDTSRDRTTKNMLKDSSITIIDPRVNKNGEILIELFLLTEKNIEFRSPLIVSSKYYSNELIFGLEKDATDGLDAHKGEFPESTSAQEDYSGFMINDYSSEAYVLSRQDIKSPVNIYCQLPIVTITPKVDNRIEDFIGCIEATSKSGDKRLLYFGYSDETNRYEEKTIGYESKDDHQGRKEYEAGFILDNKKNVASYSTADIRNIDRMSDVDSEVSSLLSKVDLDDRDHKFRRKLPRAVSGGQSQKVMISLAMASKPELLIADEPTTGLDVSMQREIIQLFKKYKNQGRTIILISHDMNFINHLADNYTIIYAGYDVEHVTTNLLKEKKDLHPYTERLIEIATSGGDKIFDAIKHDIPDPYSRLQRGCPFYPRCHKVHMISNNLEEHLCKSVSPPLVNVSTGAVMENSQIDNVIHATRCWLYVKSFDDA